MDICHTPNYIHFARRQQLTLNQTFHPVDTSDPKIGECPTLTDKIIHNEILLAAYNLADEACLIC